MTEENQVIQIIAVATSEGELPYMEDNEESDQEDQSQNSWWIKDIFKRSYSYVRSYIYKDETQRDEQSSNLEDLRKFNAFNSDNIMETDFLRRESLYSTQSQENTPSINDLTSLINAKEEQKQQLLVQLNLKSNGFMLPHPNKKSLNPLDSSDFMVIQDQVCGVADGVGQWVKYGINPRQFAEQLLTMTCDLTSEFLEQQDRKEKSVDMYEYLAKEALQRAYNKCIYPGSSTVIFYYLRGSVLYCNYIGDSQLIVLRKSKSSQEYQLVYNTVPGQRSFNAPHQLARWPTQQQLDQITIMDHTFVKRLNTIKVNIMSNANLPEELTTVKVPVQKDDIIICATDGIFDNMSSKQIVSYVNTSYEKNNSQIIPEEISKKICKAAWKLSQDPSHNSPFQKKSRKSNIKYHIGGKQDDCTLIVSKVEC